MVGSSVQYQHTIQVQRANAYAPGSEGDDGQYACPTGSRGTAGGRCTETDPPRLVIYDGAEGVGRPPCAAWEIAQDHVIHRHDGSDEEQSEFEAAQIVGIVNHHRDGEGLANVYNRRGGVYSHGGILQGGVLASVHPPAGCNDIWAQKQTFVSVLTCYRDAFQACGRVAERICVLRLNRSKGYTPVERGERYQGQGKGGNLAHEFHAFGRGCGGDQREPGRRLRLGGREPGAVRHEQGQQGHAHKKSGYSEQSRFHWLAPSLIPRSR